MADPIWRIFPWKSSDLHEIRSYGVFKVTDYVFGIKISHKQNSEFNISDFYAEKKLFWFFGNDLRFKNRVTWVSDIVKFASKIVIRGNEVTDPIWQLLLNLTFYSHTIILSHQHSYYYTKGCVIIKWNINLPMKKIFCNYSYLKKIIFHCQTLFGVWRIIWTFICTFITCINIGSFVAGFFDYLR